MELFTKILLSKACGPLSATLGEPRSKVIVLPQAPHSVRDSFYGLRIDKYRGIPGLLSNAPNIRSQNRASEVPRFQDWNIARAEKRRHHNARHMPSEQHHRHQNQFP